MRTLEKTMLCIILTTSMLGNAQSKKTVQTTNSIKVNQQIKKSESYSSIKIGNQEWMQKNLDVSNFQNGDMILEAKTKQEWIKADKEKKPAWCYYQVGYSESAKFGNPEKSKKYGKLYNWYAVNDKRGSSPKGWKVASTNDWTELVQNLGGEETAGRELKSVTGWENIQGDKGNGTNGSGFNAVPGGERSNGGDFLSVGDSAIFWCSNQTEEGRIFYFTINGRGQVDDTFVVHLDEGNKKEQGYSVRCIK